jgi:peptide/nickel transport system permease protein
VRFVSYAGKRLLQLLPVLLGITLVVFFMIHLVPGDPARTLLGIHATDAGIATLHHVFGLDQPLWRQYVDFLGRVLHGNLGTSFIYGVPVLSLITSHLGPTLWLLVFGALFAILIAAPLAVLAASRPGAARDHLVRGVPLIGLGMPSFWVGIMLILLFAVQLGWFPVSGFGYGISGHLRSIVLPALTVALALTPILVRSLRASLIEVLASDYVVTARSKGLRSSRVIIGHAMRNALGSSVVVLGVNIAYLVGSTLIVERVFGLPGIGTLMIEAIFNRDFIVVQGVTMVFAIMVVIVNLLTDIAHAALDPRIVLQ